MAAFSPLNKVGAGWMSATSAPAWVMSVGYLLLK